MIIIGIDPGVSGAYAVFNAETDLWGIHRTPCYVKMVGKSKRRFMDLEDVAEHLQYLVSITDDGVIDHGVTAYIENVHSMPKQGVVSTFSFGRNFGQWEGLLSGLYIPITYVEPRAWKRHYSLGPDKKESVATAQIMTPLGLEITHHGEAEAFLIASYGLNQMRVSQ